MWDSEAQGDIRPALTGLLAPVAARRPSWSLKRELVALAAPVSPCIVLMRRPRTTPHVGIYLRGRVLHITQHGVHYVALDIATLGFKVVGFYAPRNYSHEPA